MLIAAIVPLAPRSADISLACQVCGRDRQDPTRSTDMDRMLTYDPKKRITAREALEHEYF